MRLSLPLSPAPFTWNAALALARAAKLTYADPATVVQTAEQDWQCDKCVFLEYEDSQGFACACGNAALVAFRGTESAADWIANLRMYRTRQAYGGVHTGFFVAYRNIREQLLAALADARIGAARPLWLTGHSLGGALATIAAAELHGHANIAGVATFGQPRVGDEDFHAFMDARFAGRFWRFVHGSDLVTRLPPGLEHVGTLHHLTTGEVTSVLMPSTGKMPVAPTAPTAEAPPLSLDELEQLQHQLSELRVASLAAPPDAMAEGLLPGVRDHAIDGYIAAIEQAAQADLPI
ncbi:MAG: lipase family protein [Planctomycetales bacterium]|nr:lipase family protein [Planctomycetales bacterium]